ncbi:MAG: hypothetical protein MUE42_11670 [Opitutaceae bacterium]|jgi:hypothetical protein|nr:hypothetical protein [Opitutaceae bacterium]
MPKIDVNQVAEILKRNDIDPALLRQIVEEMNQAVEPEVDEEKPPAVKKQFSIVVSDPDNKLPEKAEFTGWVFQIPEDASVTSTTERIHKAAYEFNTTKKGRMMPAKTVADAVENIPAKHFKEQQLWVKTKAPVFVIRTDNEIPMEKGSEKDARRGRLG